MRTLRACITSGQAVLTEWWCNGAMIRLMVLTFIALL